MFNLSRVFALFLCLIMVQGALSSSLLSKFLDVPEHSFLLELDTKVMINERLISLSDELKNTLANDNIAFEAISAESGQLVIVLTSEHDVEQAYQIVESRFTSLELSSRSNATVIAQLKDSDVQGMLTVAVKRNVAVLREVFMRGKVQQINEHKIGVGVYKQDLDFFRRIVGDKKQYRLEFRLGSEADIGEAFDYSSEKIFLEPEAVVSGHLSSATVGITDTYNGPTVMITLDEEGGKKMHGATSSNIGRQMAVLLIEYSGNIVVSKKVLAFATIQSALGSSFNITGPDNLDETRILAATLNATNLVAPMNIVKENVNN